LRGGTFTNEGTLTRTGTGISDVAVATTNSGSVSVTQGLLEFGSTVANTGTMTATGSVLELTQAVSGVGALDIGTGGTMNIIKGAFSRQRWRISSRRIRWRMTISFARHQFPPAIIRHAVWLYLRFTLSYRDVEDLLAERGLDLSYETVRRWVLRFGPLFARQLRRRRPRPTAKWHLDEMAVIMSGRQFWLARGRRRRRGSRSTAAATAR
jgi:hypothetical protein